MDGASLDSLLYDWGLDTRLRLWLHCITCCTHKQNKHTFKSIQHNNYTEG